MDSQARFPRQRSGDRTSRLGTAQDQQPSVQPPAGTRSAPSGSVGGPPAVHEPGCALHRTLHASLDPADLVAVGAIRHRLRAALDRWGVPELADTAELLASELVTNALVHTAKGAVFEAVLTPARRLRIEVHDGTARMPGRRAPADHATSGRGLLLVEALADDWGVQLRGDGKVTWFELGPS
ncbi:ATP-binding protein [Kitasatospora paranensis]|uniref:ATP-binding protein n=1 Tax=Kitasatospora paranensis TaxID=258053 RepID=A0ABW2G8V8_9ACTN